MLYICFACSSPENAAADSPPLVDSPVLPDTIADSSSHDLSHQNSKAPSHFHKPSPAPAYQKPKSAIAKEHEVGPDTEQVSVGGDESQDLEIIEGDSHPDTNVDSHPANWKGGNGSVPSSPKEEARAANSGGSDSSSSSGSSGSDSDSSDSGDSATRYFRTSINLGNALLAISSFVHVDFNCNFWIWLLLSVILRGCWDDVTVGVGVAVTAMEVAAVEVMMKIWMRM